jgi:hypothetical protein
MPPYWKAAAANSMPPMTGAILGAPVLPGGTLTTSSGEKEYSQLKSSWHQAVCGLTDAQQWDTDLSELYVRMLEEGRTTAQVKALLEDNFWPDAAFSHMSVHLGIMEKMAKDIKEFNFGYNNDLFSSHRGLSPSAVTVVSMTTSTSK